LNSILIIPMNSSTLTWTNYKICNLN